MGDVSRGYSRRKRFADAQRTVLYSLPQVQREQDFLGWSEVAQRLCEVGERSAARRLFAVAQKELLNPDPSSAQLRSDGAVGHGRRLHRHLKGIPGEGGCRSS